MSDGRGEVARVGGAGVGVGAGPRQQQSLPEANLKDSVSGVQ